MLPFTVEQFFNVFAAYNTATWPAPIIAYLAGAVALAMAVSGGRVADRGVPALLGAMWLWTGIAYHWGFFASINAAATAFGAAFVAQAALFLWLGTVRGALSFGAERLRADLWVGLALVAYAAIAYPLLGWLAGHAWPAAPAFGVTPCPLTIFTFGILLLARGHVPTALLVLPALWSLIGGSAAFLLSIPQDWMLPISGLIGTVFLLRRPHHAAASASGTAQGDLA